jgi:hypothetical protein
VNNSRQKHWSSTPVQSHAVAFRAPTFRDRLAPSPFRGASRTSSLYPSCTPCLPKTTPQPPVQSTTRHAKHGSLKPAQTAPKLQIHIAAAPLHLRHHPHPRPQSNNHATPPPSTNPPPPPPQQQPASSLALNSPPTAKSAPSHEHFLTNRLHDQPTTSATRAATNPPETGSIPQSKCSSKPCAANPSTPKKTT